MKAIIMHSCVSVLPLFALLMGFASALLHSGESVFEQSYLKDQFETVTSIDVPAPDKRDRSALFVVQPITITKPQASAEG